MAEQKDHAPLYQDWRNKGSNIEDMRQLRKTIVHDAENPTSAETTWRRFLHQCKKQQNGDSHDMLFSACIHMGYFNDATYDTICQKNPFTFSPVNYPVSISYLSTIKADSPAYKQCPKYVDYVFSKILDSIAYGRNVTPKIPIRIIRLLAKHAPNQKIIPTLSDTTVHYHPLLAWASCMLGLWYLHTPNTSPTSTMHEATYLLYHIYMNNPKRVLAEQYLLQTIYMCKPTPKCLQIATKALASLYEALIKETFLAQHSQDAITRRIEQLHTLNTQEHNAQHITNDWAPNNLQTLTTQPYTTYPTLSYFSQITSSPIISHIINSAELNAQFHLQIETNEYTENTESYMLHIMRNELFARAHMQGKDEATPPTKLDKMIETSISSMLLHLIFPMPRQLQTCHTATQTEPPKSLIPPVPSKELLATLAIMGISSALSSNYMTSLSLIGTNRTH